MADKPETRSQLTSWLSLKNVTSIPLRYLLGIVFFIGLALLPFQLGILDILQMTAAFYFVMFVISWDFVSGYTGQVSFGHTLFFAAGGYTTTILNIEHGLDPVLGIPLGVLVAGLAGFLLGVPGLRLEGHYLALFTLLPPLILLRVFKLRRDIFGGVKGLPNAEPLLDAGSFAAAAESHYYLSLALLMFIFGLAWVITRSDTGTIFTAIKESEDAVQSAGINPNKFKLYAFTLSAMMGGLAGAVFVHTPAGSASPTQLLELVVMIEILLASILGGFGTITGGLVGGFIIYWGMDWFEQLDWMVPVLEIPATRIDTLLFFGLLLVVLMFLSEGLLPWALRQGRRGLSVVRGGDAAVTDGGPSTLDRQLEKFKHAMFDRNDEDERRKR